MAHLQPTSFPPSGSPAHKVRLTSLRGFTVNTARVSGEQLREAWRRRFRDRGPDHPYWLYTHVPFCPQICSFCQCSTSLRKSDLQVSNYLDWLEGEVDYFAEVAQGGLVRFQYIGGGTPNLLTEPQLDRLLGKLNSSFCFDSGSRRTFEFLPSSLRDETLALVRTHGFNRLSCGVQSWNSRTLGAVNRSRDGLDQMGDVIAEAYALGYDEINLDLIYGIGAETDAIFTEGLLEVLARRPTTVTIHNAIPTATNPIFESVDQELQAHVAFEHLQETIGAAVATRFPQVQWVLRPNSWILVDRQFGQGPDFSLWYYSDNERIHIDMLSFGRFAHSNLIGELSYENLSHAQRYDPSEASYQTFPKTPVVDAALDLVADLAGDGRSDLAPIARRHGTAALAPLEAVLERLAREGQVVKRDEVWEAVGRDGVFIDPLLPILEAAIGDTPPPWAVAMSKGLAPGFKIGAGEQSLLVFIERITPGRRYFAQIGKFGIYHRDPNQRPKTGDERWTEQLMRPVLAELERLLETSPNLSAKEATARLEDRLGAANTPR